ncbi:4-hydroxy-tetrahydrodipicolinate synthase [Gangjinia marincola]|uniref:4-hydroxy-tetrahydrodipicolinate synthase n=1 Tax=Gangjinia marincola TaxID=578463 RepID=A0ABN1MFJ1_9FLAO
MKSLKGIGVALVTPFTNENTIDVEALQQIVAYQINEGVDYLVVLGTTGEPATLDKVEKELVKKTIITANDGKLPLILGIGGNNTKSVIEELNNTDLSAFEAVLSVSPYYNKPTQEGIFAHFEAVANASPKPIILYNVPGRTASNLSPATVAKLAQVENIVAIKEAAGDIVQAMEMIRLTPEDFLVISGDDMITLPMILAGGAGVISVIGEGFPKAFSTMVHLGLEGRNTEAYAIHNSLAPCINYIFEEGNPAGIKSVFKARGMSTGEVRLPLLPASQSLEDKISRFVADFNV